MKRLLLVDDNKDVHRLISALIKRHFGEDQVFKVAAHSGTEALAILQSASFDLIICDLEMNDGNGMFLLTELEKTNSRTPFIFFTSSSRDVPNGLMGSLRAVVSKAHPKRLVTEIEKLLEIKSEHR